MSPATANWSKTKIAKLISGAVIFGVLMAERPDAPLLWERALIAACAGAVLALTLLQIRPKH